MPHTISIGNIYTAIKEEKLDNCSRVLIDRLWPRGIKKVDLNDILWLKESSPSTQLRKKFHSNIIDKTTFQKMYYQELTDNSERLQPLIDLAKQNDVQLLTATKDPNDSYLLVLRKVLLQVMA
ncbi:DUF488 family protein [Neisseriaceae bacterium PsAf]|nr:DUF488 family protein [Neisseriaceae bacterium PsAf]